MGIRTSEQLKALFQQRKEINERKKAFKPKTEKEKQDYQKQYQKQYRESHKEYAQQKSKQYRETHREYLNEYHKARYHNQPKPQVTDFPPPPVKTKKQVREIYANWLQELQTREQFLTSPIAIYINSLMQESIKNTLQMGRNKLSDEQVQKTYNDYKSLLQDLIKQRQNLDKDDPKRQDLTRKISKLSGRLNYYRRNFQTILPKEEKQSNTPTKDLKKEINLNKKQQLRQLEEMALTKITIAKQQGNEKEAKILQERLEIIRLRAKYSY